MDDIFVPKVPKDFYCEKCNYICSNKKDFSKHLMTRKHNKSYTGVTNDDNITQQNAKFECDC